MFDTWLKTACDKFGEESTWRICDQKISADIDFEGHWVILTNDLGAQVGLSLTDFEEACKNTPEGYEIQESVMAAFEGEE